MAGGFTNYGGTASSRATTNPAQQKWAFRKVYIAAFAALILALTTGMVIGFPATALNDMDKPTSSIHPSNDTKTWIASVVDLGALFGGYTAGPISQRFGRLTTLIFITAPFTVGWILIMESRTVIMMIAGRFVGGFCCGIAMASVPSYVVEISSPEIRGFLGASFQLFIAAGILLTNIIGWYIPWSWVALCSSIPAIISLIMMLFMPESPRWLVAHGKQEKAKEGIRFLHGDFIDADEEIAAIEDDLKAQDASEGMSFSEMKQARFWKPALLSMLLMLYQQICGINIIIYYTVDIFKSAGSSLDDNLATIIVSVIQTVVTIISVFIMDHAGRRILLTVSAIGMSLSLGLLGTFFFLNESNIKVTSSVYGYIPLISLVAYIACFGIGYGPVAWIMMSELAPMKARSIICGMGTGFNWTMAFVVTKTFNNLKSVIKDSGVYWFYSATCATSLFFVWCFLPETRGKALEEVLEFYTGKKTVRSNSSNSEQQQDPEQQLQQAPTIYSVT